MKRNVDYFFSGAGQGKEAMEDDLLSSLFTSEVHFNFFIHFIHIDVCL